MRNRYTLLLAIVFTVAMISANLASYASSASSETKKAFIPNNGHGNHSMFWVTGRAHVVRNNSTGSASYSGSPNIEWDIKIGSPDRRDSCTEVHETSDENYIVSGEYSFNKEDRGYLAKISSDGSLIWSKTYGDASTIEDFIAVREVKSGYILAGVTNLYSDHLDYWLVKTDTNGNIKWQRTYSCNEYPDVSVDHLTDLLVLRDGYLLIGWTLGGPDLENPFIVRTDSNGNVIWQKIYDYAPSDKDSSRFMSGEKTSGGYLLCGTVQPPSSTNYDILVVKMDDRGNVVWQKRYDSGYTLDEGIKIKRAHGGGYIIVGKSENPWVIKIDDSGNMKWSKEYSYSGMDDTIYGVNVANDGYVFIGREDVPYGDIWILKTDFSGNKKWDKVIRADDGSIGYYVEQTRDGGYIVGGEYYYSDYNSDIWIIKLSSDHQMNYKPAKPQGPTQVEVGKTYTYSTYAVHPQNKRIKFGWDWNGDEKVDQWTGFYDSGEIAEVEHSWNSRGVYNVRVIALDEDGHYSKWSDPLPVVAPIKKKPVRKTAFYPINIKIIEFKDAQHLISLFHFLKIHVISWNRGHSTYNRHWDS